ncbi:MAG: hypothetical protein HYY68_08790 [Thaumarchaeota archaeon]|nr:hypothetical protein [Nitrososphaerota archaeon]
MSDNCRQLSSTGSVASNRTAGTPVSLVNSGVAELTYFIRVSKRIWPLAINPQVIIDIIDLLRPV